jgi:nucleoside-diphosphate-sugar epimerase/predicted dehydrogenase
VLAGHPEVELAALVDRDARSAAQLAKAYRVAKVLDDAQRLVPEEIDAAVIATPPYHHAPAAIDLLRRGIHVLVEKPMATTFADAAAMVRTGDEAGVVLAVGYFRRLYPSSRLLRAAVEQQVLGPPLAFDFEEGYVFDWPSVTLGSMRKELAGGGVLIDTGSHVLDQLLSFFTGPAELLDYQDNSLGGIEADCVLRLRVRHHGEPVEGRVTLSRLRVLRNRFRLQCERGVLELPVRERDRVTVRPHGNEAVDPATGVSHEYQLEMGWQKMTDPHLLAPFRAEIDDWLRAIHSGQPPYLSGASALATVRLIEECYRQPRPLDEPWVLEGLGSVNVIRENRERPELANGEPTAPRAAGTSPAGINPAARRVLVTGASGFIGCRVAEVLRFGEGWDVRALVHNPGRAGRLARLPVEMVLGDLRCRDDLVRAVEGCDAVVHCAYGTAWGQARAIRAATVEGTRYLAEAARAAGVRRLVHLSTVAVHGYRVTGDLDEGTPVRPDDDIYAETKAVAEKVITQAARAGLSAVTLRLANVYGPFSGPYTVRPVQQLAHGLPVLLGDGSNPSNTVFVDNVVEAIVRGLEAPDDVVRGQTFTISDGDDLTWADFYRHYAEALGLKLRSVPLEEYERLRAARPRGGLFRWLGSCFRAAKEVLTSTQLKDLGVKFLQTDPLGYWPRWLLERFPGLKHRLRRLLKLDCPPVYREAAVEPVVPPLELLELYACPARVRIDKARRLLGYRPVVSRERAMALTLAWVRHARLGEELAFRET